jgi:HEPN domain-containing protein
MDADAERKAEAAAWLRKAALDLRCAEVDVEARPPIVEDALFHCQQAVEKAFQAFLLWHGAPLEMTYDLEELGRRMVELDESVKPLVDQVSGLTRYNWLYRYPGEAVVMPIDELSVLMFRLRRTLTQLSARLPVGVRL